jgi:ankyrin repeat protein
MSFKVAINRTITDVDDGGKEYTRYVLEIEDTSGGGDGKVDDEARTLRWTIRARYSDLNAFHQSVKKQFKSAPGFPRFPGRKFTGQMDPQFIEQRKRALESYFQLLLSMDSVAKSAQVDEWLRRAEFEQIGDDDADLDLDGLVEIESLTIGTGVASSSSSSSGARGVHAAAMSGDVDTLARLVSSDAKLLEIAEPPPLSDYELQHSQTIDNGGGGASSSSALLSSSSSSGSVTSSGRTPLHVAIANRRAAAVRYLLENGADLEAQDGDGLTPLLHAARCGDPETLAIVLNSNPDASARTFIDNTALHHYAECFEAGVPNETLVFQALVEKGASISQANIRGDTPLQLAARAGNVGLLKLLIDSGAPVDAQNKEEETALHFAARAGKQRAVSFLVQAGADVNIHGKHGTPLDLVQQRKNK